MPKHEKPTAKLKQLVLAIDAECSNAKPDFGRVVQLAAEAAVLARAGDPAATELADAARLHRTIEMHSEPWLEPMRQAYALLLGVVANSTREEIEAAAAERLDAALAHGKPRRRGAKQVIVGDQAVSAPMTFNVGRQK